MTSQPWCVRYALLIEYRHRSSLNFESHHTPVGAVYATSSTHSGTPRWRGLLWLFPSALFPSSLYYFYLFIYSFIYLSLLFFNFFFFAISTNVGR